MAWMRAITGRLESRYMYSVGVAYNTFPVNGCVNSSSWNPSQRLAQAVLDAPRRPSRRDAWPSSTILRPDATGFAPRPSCPLDLAVDRLYRPAPVRLRPRAGRAPLRPLTNASSPASSPPPPSVPAGGKPAVLRGRNRRWRWQRRTGKPPFKPPRRPRRCLGRRRCTWFPAPAGPAAASARAAGWRGCVRRSRRWDGRARCPSR